MWDWTLRWVAEQLLVIRPSHHQLGLTFWHEPSDIFLLKLKEDTRGETQGRCTSRGRGSVRYLRLMRDIVTILVKAPGLEEPWVSKCGANIGLWQFVRKMSQYSGHSHHLWGPNCRVSCEVFIILPWVRLLLLERNCVKDGPHWEETIAIIQLSTTRIKVSADNQNTWRSVYNCHRKKVHLWQNIYLLYKKLDYTSIYCSCSTAITINGNTSLDTGLCEN